MQESDDYYSYLRMHESQHTHYSSGLKKSYTRISKDFDALDVSNEVGVI